MVFSDGLAAISVFIEPLSANLDEGLARLGAIHVLKRRIDSHQAVVMGEVPALAVNLLGGGIERKAR
jgi:sigma-E factor negative regulatory protein RseB